VIAVDATVKSFWVGESEDGCHRLLDLRTVAANNQRSSRDIGVMGKVSKKYFIAERCGFYFGKKRFVRTNQTSSVQPLRS
jgi:hypothetical protein